MNAEGTSSGPDKPKARAASRFSLWGLVEALGVCAAASTLISFVGELNWLLELTTHFRVQHLASLIAISGLLLIGRRFKSATAFLICALLNAAVLAPWLVPGSKTTPTGKPFCAMVLNVRTENTRHALALAEIHRVQPDVVLLMEVDSKWARALEDLGRTFPHRVLVAREDNFGIALFSRHPLISPKIEEWAGDFGVPSITAVVEFPDQRLFLVGTHPLPPGSRENAGLRNEQLEKVADAVTRQRLPALVLGDLNATPWSPYFRRLERSASLRDTGRRSGWHPTWPAGFPLFGIPLDHCLVTREFAVVSRTIGNDVGSDHYPVIVDLVFPTR